MLQKESQPLSEQQKAELNQLFKHPAVLKIMEHAQYCSSLEGIERKKIVKAVLYAIQQINLSIDQATIQRKEPKIKKSAKPRESKNIKKMIDKNKKINLVAIHINDLEIIIGQILQHMKIQSNEFYNYLALQYVKRGYSRDCDVAEFLAEFLLQSFNVLNLTLKDEVGLLIPEAGMQILKKAEECIREHYQADWGYKFIGKLGIVSCIANFFYEGFLNNFEVNVYQVRNLFLFILACGIYLYGYKFVNYTFKNERKEFSSLDFPHYQLEEIKLVDIKGQLTQEVIYLPNFDNKVQEELFLERENVEGQKDEGQVVSRHKVKTRPQSEASSDLGSISTLPRAPLNASVFWPGEAVWFYNAQSQIFPQQTTEIRSNFFSKSLRYFGFFNTPALRAQNLTEKDSEWTNYQARVEGGNVVPPRGNTGIKQLKQRILADVKIGNRQFNHQLFGWSAKTVKTEYRLLGRTAHTQMSAEGIQYKLVDFCWHLPKGPGH